MALFGGITLPGKPDLENVRKLDLLPIPMIRRIQRGGWAIDREYLWDLGSDLARDMKELQKDIASYIPPDRLEEFTARSVEFEEEFGSAQMNAASAEQIGTLLFDILGVGESRQLKRTADGKRISTGKKQLELIKSDHPVVQKILDYRERSKLKTSFCDTLPEIARFHPRSVGSSVCPECERHHAADTWRVHTEIATTRAATGRLASRKPNLSQIPTRTELGAAVRLAFIASPGNVLVSRDFAQIELRDLAHCAQAGSMMQVYREDKDIHVYTACEAFQLDYDYYWRLINTSKKLLTAQEKSDLEEFKQFKRMPSKNLNFMICIEENQNILTNRGYVPIQHVTKEMLLWDGVEWVKHEGVVFNGYKRVIEHAGVVGTPDHQVWTEFGEKISLEQAHKTKARLAVTADQGNPVGHFGNYIERDSLHWQKEISSRLVSLLQLRSTPGGFGRQHSSRENQNLYMRTKETYRSSLQEFSGQIPSYRSKVLESALRKLGGLRGKGHQESIQILGRFYSLHPEISPARRLQRVGHRANQQQQALFPWQFAAGEERTQPAQYAPKSLGELQREESHRKGFIRTSQGRLREFRSVPGQNATAGLPRRTLAGDIEAQKQGKVPVYDILNAGPRHRFTCEGKLVSNCYGATVIGLLAQLALSGVLWTEEEGNAFIDRWFNLYPEVRAYMELQYYRARRYGRVWDIFGRPRLVPEVKSFLGWIKSAGLRQCGNMPIQSCSAGQLKLVMGAEEEMLLEMEAAGVDCWPLIVVHDQSIVEVEEKYAKTVDQAMDYCFENVMVDRETGEHCFRVPIKSDGEIVSRWVKD